MVNILFIPFSIGWCIALSCLLEAGGVVHSYAETALSMDILPLPPLCFTTKYKGRAFPTNMLPKGVVEFYDLPLEQYMR